LTFPLLSYAAFSHQIKANTAAVVEGVRDKTLAAAGARFEAEIKSLKAAHMAELDDLRSELVKENTALADQLEEVESELRKEVENAFTLSQEFLQSQQVSTDVLQRGCQLRSLSVWGSNRSAEEELDEFALC
jgi:Skp family chaperone for outer membrane proteins